jgi:carboxypeptidase PM20D1
MGRIAGVGTAEKGSVSIELLVETEGGHSSMPSGESAIGTLAGAVQRLEESPMPSRFEGHLGETLAAAAPGMSLAYRVPLMNQWLFGPLIDAAVSRMTRLSPMVRTTTATTIFQAGVKENVLPSSARAIVNFRLFPGDSLETVVDHVTRVVDDERVKITPAGGVRSAASVVSDLGAPAGQLLAETIRQSFGALPVVPILIPGGTDARYFRDISGGTFGFTPIAMPAEDVRRAHGLDERISAAAYLDGVRFYVRLLENAGAADWPSAEGGES